MGLKKNGGGEVGEEGVGGGGGLTLLTKLVTFYFIKGDINKARDSFCERKSLEVLAKVDKHN